MTQRLIGLITAALFVLSAFPAWTQEVPPPSADGEEAVASKVERLSEEGAELFGQAAYAEAIERFEEAYKLEPVANLLYNIALSYERMGDKDNAIVYYEKFIIAGDADPENRSKALKRARALQDERDYNNRKNKPPQEPTPAKRDDGLGGLAVTGIVATGLGAAMAGTGAVFGLMAQETHDNFKAARNVQDKRSFQEDAEQSALIADILFISGGVAIASGVTMIIIDSVGGNEAPANSSHWQLTPTFGQDHVGAMMTIALDP